MKKKLLLSAILIYIGVFAFGIINAFAETYGDLTYEIIDNKITITDCNREITGELIIPSEINGYPVITIDNFAFDACGKLKKVIIPDSVTSIGNFAFDLCHSLTSVNIPYSVNTIGTHPFYRCENIESINVDEKNLYYSSVCGILFNKDKTILIQCPSANTITEYDIPNSVIYIEDYAFYNCINLMRISIPDSVAYIGSSAFTNSGYYNNKNNWADGDLYINKHLIEVSKKAVSYCVPEGILTIAGGAFSHCEKMTNVTIPNSVVSFGTDAFYYCTGLKNISIPESVKYIGKSAFGWCTGLTSITIPDGVVSIESLTFYNCTNLKNITLPKLAFSWCKSLSSIMIPDSVKTIGIGAFGRSGVLTIYYPSTEEDWNKIIIEDSNDDLLSVKKIYNFEISIDIIEATSTENSLKFISKATINKNDEIASFGTTFIPLWLFESGATNTAIVKYDNSDHSIKNGQTFGATLSGIPDMFRDMDIVGKSFIKKEDGEYVWSDAQCASVSDTTLKTIE